MNRKYCPRARLTTALLVASCIAALECDAHYKTVHPVITKQAYDSFIEASASYASFKSCITPAPQPFLLSYAGTRKTDVGWLMEGSLTSQPCITSRRAGSLSGPT